MYSPFQVGADVTVLNAFEPVQQASPDRMKVYANIISMAASSQSPSF